MTKKDIDTRVSEIDKRRAELEAERKRLLSQKSKADRKADTRRKIIVGGIVLADEALKKTVLPTLDAKLTKSADRALFWLPERVTDASPAQAAEAKPARPSSFASEDGKS